MTGFTYQLLDISSTLAVFFKQSEAASGHRPVTEFINSYRDHQLQIIIGSCGNHPSIKKAGEIMPKTTAKTSAKTSNKTSSAKSAKTSAKASTAKVIPSMSVPSSIKQALPFVPVAALDRLAAHLDPNQARAMVLSRVDENQKAALATIKRVKGTVDRFVPSLPGEDMIRTAVKTNVDFAVKLAKKQADFVGKAVKTVAA